MIISATNTPIDIIVSTPTTNNIVLELERDNVSSALFLIPRVEFPLLNKPLFF